MRRYEEYKDSGIDWLPKVPKNWQLKRIDEMAKIVRGNCSFKRDELLEEGTYVALQYGKTYQVDEINHSFNFYVNDEFYKSNQIVKQGDTILISTSETIEDLGHSCFFNRKDLGLLGGEQLMLKPNNKLVSPKFLYYFSKYYRNEIKKYATGLKVYRYNIDDLKNIFVPVFSVPEQQAIANYLDAKTQAIDKKVSLLEQKIETYKKLKRTLINQTITKGLRSLSEVEMKDSGISWIGQIPQHWEVKRLKDVFNTFSGGTPSTKVKEYWNGNLPWIPSGKVQNNIIDREVVEDFISQDALKESSTKMAKSGSLLIALTGATCSNIGLLTFDTTINQSIVALNQKKDIEKKFFFYFLISASLKIRSSMTGGAQAGINQEDVKFLDLLLPPKSEQEEIANYLDHKTATIDAIVSNIGKQIDTLKQLRKTVINDVVTGKIKVYDD